MTYDMRSSTYRDVDVLSSSPEQLVPLLYKHILVNLRRAVLCIRRKDIEGKFESLGRAADIVAELRGVLDFEAGGEVSVQLSSLYGFWAKEMSEAGGGLDAARLERVAAMVAELYESWESAAGAVKSGGEVASAKGAPQ